MKEADHYPFNKDRPIKRKRQQEKNLFKGGESNNSADALDNRNEKGENEDYGILCGKRRCEPKQPKRSRIPVHDLIKRGNDPVHEDDRHPVNQGNCRKRRHLRILNKKEGGNMGELLHLPPHDDIKGSEVQDDAGIQVANMPFKPKYLKPSKIPVHDLISGGRLPVPTAEPSISASLSGKPAHATDTGIKSSNNRNHLLSFDGDTVFTDYLDEGPKLNELVRLVANAVANEIRSGVWRFFSIFPCPLHFHTKTNDPTSYKKTLKNGSTLNYHCLLATTDNGTTKDNNHNESLPQGNDTIQSKDQDLLQDNTEFAALAVEYFAVEIFCPYLSSSRMNIGDHLPKSERVAISTLLAIREMMIINSDKFFSTASNQASSDSPSREEYDVQDNSKDYAVHAHVSGIVLVAAKKLCSLLSFLSIAKYHRAANSYDFHHSDFQIAMPAVDARSVHVLPDGSHVGDEENIIMRVGFNYVRESHPLLYNGKNSLSCPDSVLMKGDTKISVSLPLPNSCAAFIRKLEPITSETTVNENFPDNNAYMDYQQFQRVWCENKTKDYNLWKAKLFKSHDD